MNTGWLQGMVVVAALTGFAAVAEETAPLGAELRTPQQDIGAELSASIREWLHGVTPEITLPTIDVPPPTPVAAGG